MQTDLWVIPKNWVLQFIKSGARIGTVSLDLPPSGRAKLFKALKMGLLLYFLTKVHTINNANVDSDSEELI